MILRPFFSYFGSKFKACRAGLYPAPAHNTIVEPFAGSATYSLVHPELRVELYDLSPVVCGAWDYLIRASPRDILSLPDVPIGGTTHDMGDSVCQEAKYLIGFWLNRASAAPKYTATAWSYWRC